MGKGYEYMIKTCKIKYNYTKYITEFVDHVTFLWHTYVENGVVYTNRTPQSP